MTLRVIQWATGPVGMAQLREIVERPDLDLARVLVYSPAKADLDAGELIDRSTIFTGREENVSPSWDAVDRGSVSRSSSRVLTAMFAMSASALIGVRHGIPLNTTRRDRLVVSLNTQVTGCVLQVDP